MKNNLLKFYIVAIYLCSTVVLFAQEPGVDDGTGTFESSNDNTGTPIGEYAWVLALAIIVFTFYIYKSIQNEKNS
jgi:hypothetical protein